MAEINFNTVARATNFNAAADTLHITQGGTHKQLLLEDLINEAKNQSLTSMEAALLDKLTEGCYVAYKQNSTWRLVSASRWLSDMNNSEVVPYGVAVIEDNHVRAMALDEVSMKWGNANSLVNTQYNYGAVDDLLSQFDGKQRTAAIVAHEDYGSDQECAAVYCNTYSRGGRDSGNWFLGAYGEVMMFMKRTHAVNALLSLIDGASMINLTDSYWTSTERIASNAHTVGWRNGILAIDNIYSYSKTANHRVRPICIPGFSV